MAISQNHMSFFVGFYKVFIFLKQDRVINIWGNHVAANAMVFLDLGPKTGDSFVHSDRINFDSEQVTLD